VVSGDPAVEDVRGEASGVKGKYGETAIRMEARYTMSGMTAVGGEARYRISDITRSNAREIS